MFEANVVEVALVAIERAVVQMVLDIGNGSPGMVFAQGADLDVTGPASLLVAVLAGTAIEKLCPVGVGKKLPELEEGLLLKWKEVECTDVGVLIGGICARVSV